MLEYVMYDNYTQQQAIEDRYVYMRQNQKVIEQYLPNRTAADALENVMRRHQNLNVYRISEPTQEKGMYSWIVEFVNF
jgi:hypothetical protein